MEKRENQVSEQESGIYGQMHILLISFPYRAIMMISATIILQSLNSKALFWMRRDHSRPATATMSRKMKMVSTMTSVAPRGLEEMGINTIVMVVCEWWVSEWVVVFGVGVLVFWSGLSSGL